MFKKPNKMQLIKRKFNDFDVEYEIHFTCETGFL